VCAGAWDLMGMAGQPKVKETFRSESEQWRRELKDPAFRPCSCSQADLRTSQLAILVTDLRKQSDGLAFGVRDPVRALYSRAVRTACEVDPTCCRVLQSPSEGTCWSLGRVGVRFVCPTRWVPLLVQEGRCDLGRSERQASDGSTSHFEWLHSLLIRR
jgi:hypothetical protein